MRAGYVPSAALPGGGPTGMLTTAGGLVFSGDGAGNLVALDAASGKPLWRSRVGNVSNAPQTYMLDGKQYLLTAVGDMLAAFVIAGTMCGLAGALLANNTDFVSPAVMYWTRSGDLMVMVILGGMGTLFGPVIGGVIYLVLEQLLSQVTEYWAIIMGPLLLLVVLFGRGGIMGLLGRFSRG